MAQRGKRPGPPTDPEPKRRRLSAELLEQQPPESPSPAPPESPGPPSPVPLESPGPPSPAPLEPPPEPPETPQRRRDKRWQIKLGRLRDYVARTGRQPKCQEDDGEWKIGEWCNMQRRERDEMAPERVRALESVLGWRWSRSTWWETFKKLQEFVEAKERLPKYREKYEEINLGVWCASQRVRHEAKKLDPERAAALETVAGWRWLKPATRWEEKIRRLAEYVEREGCLPRGNDHDGEWNIGRWCTAQRRRRSRLRRAQIAALEAIAEWEW